MTAYDTLISGDILGAVLEVYTGVFDFWLYIIMLMGLMGMVYWKSKNVPMVTVIGLIIGTALMTSGLLPPEGIGVLQVIIVLGIAGTLYQVFGKRG